MKKTPPSQPETTPPARAEDLIRGALERPEITLGEEGKGGKDKLPELLQVGFGETGKAVVDIIKNL